MIVGSVDKCKFGRWMVEERHGEGAGARVAWQLFDQHRHLGDTATACDFANRSVCRRFVVDVGLGDREHLPGVLQNHALEQATVVGQLANGPSVFVFGSG